MARSYLCTCSVHWLGVGVGVGSYRGTVGVRVGVYKFRPSSAYHQRTTHSDDMLHMCSMPSYVAVPSACLSHRQPCVPAALIHTLIRTYAYTYVAAPSRHLPPTDRVSRPRVYIRLYVHTHTHMLLHHRGTCLPLTVCPGRAYPWALIYTLSTAYTYAMQCSTRSQRAPVYIYVRTCILRSIHTRAHM